MVGRTNVGGGGGSSEGYAYVQATFPSGSTCTATNGVSTLTAANTDGLYVFNIPEPSSTPESWTIACTDGTKTASNSISIANQYQVDQIRLSYSRLPEGYQEVEYLQSDGTAYIKTLHTYITYTEQLEIDFMLLTSSTLSTNRCLFAYSYGTGASNSYQGFGNVNGTWVYRFYQQEGSGPSQSSILTVNSTANLNTKIAAVINDANHQIKENNSVVSSTTPIKYPAYNVQNITARLPLFCACDISGSYQNNSAISARVYKFIRTDTSNNTVVENLVPCRRTSDSRLGMYDLVSDTFLYNSASSGSFTAGPDV